MSSWRPLGAPELPAKERDVLRTDHDLSWLECKPSKRSPVERLVVVLANFLPGIALGKQTVRSSSTPVGLTHVAVHSCQDLVTLLAGVTEALRHANINEEALVRMKGPKILCVGSLYSRLKEKVRKIKMYIELLPGERSLGLGDGRRGRGVLLDMLVQRREVRDQSELA